MNAIAKHEQQLKHLEKSVRNICETCIQAERFMKETWHLSMELLAVADDLRQTRLAFEKENPPQDSPF